ncbi:MAG TPA: phage tail protein [Verrucomicrobiota bacterium]|nr:hypothetical protein [Verrucomicrobiales bacterium]HRI12410.1 phage tail protein [Verrucomicrobiota bacterium]
MATTNVSPTAAFIELEGANPSPARSVDGGAVTASVVEQWAGRSPFAAKNLGPVQVEEFVAELRLDLEQSMADWISTMWSGKFSVRNGRVLLANRNNQTVDSRRFTNAVLTEVGVPALDASSKDVGYLTVKLAPEAVVREKPGGQISPVSSRAKAWLTANFRLEIDGLDCTRVAKIDGFTIKQKMVEESLRDRRMLSKSGRVQFPNLRITLGGVNSPQLSSWAEWFDDFVVKGNCDDSREKNGALVFLAPDLKTELGRIGLFNLGIFRFAPAKVEAGTDTIARTMADLYCQRMELKLVGADPSPRTRQIKPLSRGATGASPKARRSR